MDYTVKYLYKLSVSITNKKYLAITVQGIEPKTPIATTAPQLTKTSPLHIIIAKSINCLKLTARSFKVMSI